MRPRSIAAIAIGVVGVAVVALRARRADDDRVDPRFDNDHRQALLDQGLDLDDVASRLFAKRDPDAPRWTDANRWE